MLPFYLLTRTDSTVPLAVACKHSISACAFILTKEAVIQKGHRRCNVLFFYFKMSNNKDVKKDSFF